MKAVAFAIALLALGSTSAIAFDRLILGRSLRVLDPAGRPEKRRVTLVGRQEGLPLLSDPRPAGTLLTITLEGGTSSSQTYLLSGENLDGKGWHPMGARVNGFRYRGPTGADGDPVKSLVIRRSSAGVVTLKITLLKSVDSQTVELFPPNPGAEGSVVLDIGGGDRYCITFGGAAGGVTKRDTAEVWQIVQATQTAPCHETTTTTSTTSTTTLP